MPRRNEVSQYRTGFSFVFVDLVSTESILASVYGLLFVVTGRETEPARMFDCTHQTETHDETTQ